MLVNTDLTVAYRCPVCGSFRFGDISVFRLGTDTVKICSCCRCAVRIVRKGRGMYRVSVPCIGCGSNHVYNIEMPSIVKKDVLTFFCDITGIQHFFIGKDEHVRRRVDRYETELEGIADCLGYDSYFKNSHVMLDMLIRLHEMAEQGSLCCECGSGDIEISLLSDRIFLKCRNCPGKKVIFASSNKDLKDIRLRKGMLLS